MKYQLMTALVAATTLSLSGQALAETALTGHVGANYDWNYLDVDNAGHADAGATQLEGAVAFPVDMFSVQLDGAITNFDADAADATAFAGTGHLNLREGSNILGAFAGVAHSDDVTLWGLGAEGQVALSDKANVQGQLGYGRSDDINNINFWAVRIEGRYFVTDNLRLSLSTGYANGDSDAGDLNISTLGASAEYQIASTPWSVYGAFERGEIDDLDFTSDTTRIGVRYTFGGSLKAQDQAGASLSSITNLFGGSLGAGLVAVAGALIP